MSDGDPRIFGNLPPAYRRMPASTPILGQTAGMSPYDQMPNMTAPIEDRRGASTGPPPIARQASDPDLPTPMPGGASDQGDFESQIAAAVQRAHGYPPFTVPQQQLPPWYPPMNPGYSIPPNLPLGPLPEPVPRQTYQTPLQYQRPIDPIQQSLAAHIGRLMAAPQGGQ